MRGSTSRGEIHLDVETGRSEASSRPEPDTPFRIAILGDFSGRASLRGRAIGEAAATLRLTPIDRDNFDDVMAKFAPQIELPRLGPIRFRALDDFHPDRLLQRLVVPQRTVSVEPTPAKVLSRPPSPPPLALDGLLDETIERTESRAEGHRPETRDPFQAWLREVVAPHTIAASDPRETELRERANATRAGLIRALLHQPAFQALEGAWRSVFFLVRRIHSDVTLKLHLLDISKQELADELKPAYEILARASTEMPWAVMIGNYTFGPEASDLQLLAGLGAMAQELGAPWFAEADPRLVDAPPSSLSWASLRRLPQARWLSLALPRFLLRLPYGKETDPCERFEFEEMDERPEHNSYLWGNPAFVCACLLAESFTADGWDLRPGSHVSLDGLPLHVYREDGAATARPCAEVLLTEETAEQILNYGIMPLACLKNRDTLRLVRFQSIADPATPVAGKWT